MDLQSASPAAPDRAGRRTSAVSRLAKGSSEAELGLRPRPRDAARRLRLVRVHRAGEQRPIV